MSCPPESTMNQHSATGPVPVSITLHTQSRNLVLEYEGGNRYELPCEFLRVYTPSAEARGHGPGQEVLQVGKKNVGIEQVVPVGQYAVCLVFTDGHDTGIYSWDLLFDFCKHRDQLWANYLQALEGAGASREPDEEGSKAKNKGCGR